MKAKLLKALHFFKLDVLLLRLLERLSASLTKKHEAFRRAIECYLCCRISVVDGSPADEAFSPNTTA